MTVSSAQMILNKEEKTRLIHVDAGPEDWPHEVGMLGVMATIAMDGNWDGTVDVRCCGSHDPLSGNTPWMKGRERVLLEQLIEQLRETLQEREQVIAAIKFGIDGPYSFTHSVWEVPDLLRGLGLE